MRPATQSARNKQKLIPNPTHKQSCNSSPLALPEHCALLWIALHQNQPKAGSSKTATYRRRDALPILVDQARTQPMPKDKAKTQHFSVHKHATQTTKLLMTNRHFNGANSCTNPQTDGQANSTRHSPSAIHQASTPSKTTQGQNTSSAMRRGGFADTQTGMLPGKSRKRNVRSKF